jgi:hypothetical protein
MHRHIDDEAIFSPNFAPKAHSKSIEPTNIPIETIGFLGPSPRRAAASWVQTNTPKKGRFSLDFAVP